MCIKVKTITTEDFIESANKVHNVFYDYSQCDYKNRVTKVTIICPIHGEFRMSPAQHLIGGNCQKCVKQNRYLTREKFIEKANIIHNNFYDYSQGEYKDRHTQMKIICPKHGEFYQKPEKRIRGRKCNECSTENRTYTQQNFIEQANIIHNNFYDYSQCNYKNRNSKIKIICPKHGEFFQDASHHLEGRGCRKCSSEDKSMPKEDFVKKSGIIHNNFYDYSQCDYKDRNTKTKIICPIHGEFFQIPAVHLSGCGCTRCCSSKGEKKIEKYLKNKHIVFITQKTFDGCIGKKRQLSFDFYLPNYNICIEYDGIQHFEEVKRWGGKEQLE